MRKLLAAAIILAVTLVGIGVIAGTGLSRAGIASNGDLLLTYDLTSTDVSVQPIDTTCRQVSAGTPLRVDVVAKNAVDWAGMDFVVNYPDPGPPNRLLHPVLSDSTANDNLGLDVVQDPSAGFDFVPATTSETAGSNNFMDPVVEPKPPGGPSALDYSTTEAAPTSDPHGVSMFDNNSIGKSGDGGMARIQLDTTGLSAGVYIISVGLTGQFAGGVHTDASGFLPDNFGAVFFTIIPTACPTGTPTPAPTGTPTPVPTSTPGPGTATPSPTATPIPTPTPLCGPGVAPGPAGGVEPPDDGSALLCHFESNINTATEPPDTCTVGLECDMNTLITIDSVPPTGPVGTPGTTLNPAVTILTDAAFTFASDVTVADGDEVGRITVSIRTDGGFLGACTADLGLGPNPLFDGTIDTTTSPVSPATAGPPPIPFAHHHPRDLFNPLVWPQQLTGEVAAVQAAFGGPLAAPLYARAVTSFDIDGDGEPDIPLNILYFQLNPAVAPPFGWVTQSFTGDPVADPAVNPANGVPIIPAPMSPASFCTPFSADTTIDGTSSPGIFAQVPLGGGSRLRTCDVAGAVISSAAIEPNALNPTSTDTGQRVDASACGEAQHDNQLRRILSPVAVLSNESVSTEEIFCQVRNQSDHTEAVTCYIDVVPPGGATLADPDGPFDCIPNGRILDASVTLDPGKLANLFADTGVQGDDLVEFSCGDQAGAAAAGATYTIIAVVDHAADDNTAAGPCDEGNLGTVNCFSHLAGDDNDPSDNRVSRSAPKVKKASTGGPPGQD